ncbi:MAG: iron-sulfur cluster insertion protein ErpA [Hyphomicrobiaceae bacterium]|nr:iron-sulfur cluster insertion protein ErpA [Hyphomicrobiaceae bacterium]
MSNVSISVSDAAATRIKEIITSEPDGTMFRMSVSGGGCSGFQYNFEFVQNQNEDDMVLEKGGIKVLVDSISQMYLVDSELDFSDDLIGAAFKVNNPNATASCGCGTSFSI